jgi:Raf kinase inhibitor-like YbhB/YbcL family protein
MARSLALVAAAAIASVALAACSGSTAGATPSVAPATPPPSVASTPSPTPAPASPSARETAVTTASPPPASQAPLRLTSSSFAADGPIPAEFTCRGADRSPALAWTGVPAGAAALVLFVDDPDGRDWVHWSVLDMPASTTGLPEGVKPSQDPPQQGTNDFGKVGYGGPCPPSGTHHYRFTLYALAAPLGLPGHPKGDAVRSALASAGVLGKVTIVGTFAK